MPYLGYVLILASCAAVALVSLGRVREKYNPFILYGSAAAMVLMTTLAGPYMFGSDIHLDYYYAQLRNGGDVWQPLVGIPQGSSVLSYITGSMWAYKVVYPLLYCFVPVILYFVYRKWLTAQQSFLGAFLFIAFPAFFMEVPTIARQMVAEVFLALALYLAIKSTLRLRYKLPLLIIVAALMPLFHYSTGIIGLMIFGIGLVVSLVLRQGMWKQAVVVMASIIIVGAGYFAVVEEASVLRKVGHLYNYFAPAFVEVEVDPLIIPTPPHIAKPPETPGPNEPVEPKEPVKVATTSKKPLIERYETLVQIGLGVDFLETSALGKAFRLLQWAMVVVIAVGLWKLRRNANYWVFASGAFLITALCLLPVSYTHLTLPTILLV